MLFIVFQGVGSKHSCHSKRLYFFKVVFMKQRLIKNDKFSLKTLPSAIHRVFLPIQKVILIRQESNLVLPFKDVEMSNSWIGEI